MDPQIQIKANFMIRKKNEIKKNTTQIYNYVKRALQFYKTHNVGSPFVIVNMKPTFEN